MFHRPTLNWDASSGSEGFSVLLSFVCIFVCVIVHFPHCQRRSRCHRRERLHLKACQPASHHHQGFHRCPDPPFKNNQVAVLAVFRLQNGKLGK